MDKTALITGAADRIGAAIARRLSAEGFAVVIHHRGSGDKAEALAETISAAGRRAVTLKADLIDRQARARVITQAAAFFGPLTLLVNNASSFDPDSVETLEETLWDTHIAIHGEAPVFLARDFAAQLPAGLKGNIVNIIDERVLDLSPAYFSYTLSKAMLWTATRTLAQALAPSIRVNAIGPGPTLPPAGESAQAFQASRARLPLATAADPEEIAQGVVSILNLPSMTGQMLALDGGQHLQWPERRGPTPRRP